MSVKELIDLLLTVPYRACPTAPYITVIFVLCSLFAIPTVVWGFVAQDDEVIPYCNPPLGLAPNVSHFWSVSNVVVNCIVLLVYATIIGFVHFRVVTQPVDELQPNQEHVMSNAKSFVVCKS
ncbi:hypothetical protein ANCCEY_13908 [Ancylostoma ceylanicum]|uniref:G-protein coupled receptors family 1 profile domain-containing protein n=1 Tax=Ancylostoma ceylanicum TaxID=53326 RepID=A0A0D6L6G9_9BILA|nr:hypothetical protein ANCCEY_13908 [Ancylostoma ceylanicum]